jgi:beta-glucosidase
VASALDARGRVLDLVGLAQAARPPSRSARRGRAPRARPRGRRARDRAAAQRGVEGALLPLAADATVALIGEFARTPRYQGGGSSHINPTRVDSASTRSPPRPHDRVAFAPGFAFDAAATGQDALRAEAVALAASRDVAVAFLGLTDAEESEGFDRDHIDLAAHQLALLDAVVAANPRTSSCSNGWSSRCPSPTGCPRSSRRGCSARPADPPPSTCCSAR